MAEPVYTKTYDLPPCDIGEVFRYARAGSDPSPDLMALAEDCLRELEGKLTSSVCWQVFPISRQGQMLDLTFAQTNSAGLREHLAGCDSIVVFAATVGLAPDRLIARYNRLSPARALLFQAIGAERVEALCDCFNREITQQQAALGRRTASRFSPGYGDLPLTLQRDIFRVLDCPRKIGLTLNESLLMSPSKSVTAIIGCGNAAEGMAACGSPSGCAACTNTSCPYRRHL